MSGLCGIWGRPYLDLSQILDTSCFAILDEEIAYGLARAETTMTGGSLKWMGVVSPSMRDDPYVDYGHVLARLTPEELRRFVSLAEDPEAYDPSRPAERSYGDETGTPLTREQARYLSYRHDVYFPWKVCYHLVTNDRWEDKHSGAGKRFSEEARELFPETVKYIERLPFVEIGRAVIFGLEPNDHAPAHRDTEPGEALSIAQSISFSPRGNKRLYLCDEDGEHKMVVTAPIYWFNDMDYHGVEAAPFFRYSVRVDGIFEAGFVKELRRKLRA